MVLYTFVCTQYPVLLRVIFPCSQGICGQGFCSQEVWLGCCDGLRVWKRAALFLQGRLGALVEFRQLPAVPEQRPVRDVPSLGSVVAYAPSHLVGLLMRVVRHLHEVRWVDA